MYHDQKKSSPIFVGMPFVQFPHSKDRDQNIRMLNKQILKFMFCLVH